MVSVSRLGQVFLLLLLLLGMQCSFRDSNTDNDQQKIDEIHQPGFARDTVLIYKYHRLGTNYLYKNAKTTLRFAKGVLKLSQKHQWNKGKIMAYNLLSTYYLSDGSFDVLRELSNETMTLSQRLNLPFYTAHAKRFNAESYSEYRKWDSAQINYQEALSIFTRIGADSAKAICLENMGNSYRENDKYEKAFESYNQAYSIFEKLGSESGKATVLQSKGYLYVRKKEYAKSEALFLRALSLYRQNDNFYGELGTMNDLGNIYYWTHRYDESIEICSKALQYARAYHSWQQTNWALQALSRSYRAKNMLDTAMAITDELYLNRRMLHDEYIQNQYTMYQIMYENEQKDSEIQQSTFDNQKRIQQFLIGIISLVLASAAFLWFNNKKLRRKNSEIKEALIQGQTIERKRVAAELHDHLGGTLASLNWYLYGIDKTALSAEEQKIYDSVHQMVGAAYREVRSLSHNLMPAELEEHGLIMALHRLIGKLNENKNLELSFNANGLDKRYVNKVEFELYSIILELTNNIFKHSGATTASLNLNENAKNIVLIISDNGRGINNSSKHGVGLTNVKNRVESLSGKIEILQEPEKGTRIEIEIPKSVI